MTLFHVVLMVLLSGSLAEAADCTRSSQGFVPLTDGVGLYPDGTNTPPHVNTGLSHANDLRTRAVNVLLAVGMSNTRMEFDAFQVAESYMADRRTNLTLVNGAMNGQVAQRWASTRNLTPYDNADLKLMEAGRTPADVGVLWVKLTDLLDGSTLPQWKATFKANVKAALTNLVAHYPNVAMIYLSSRTYGGYEPPSRTALNPEPYAYETGVVLKEIVAEHLGGSFLPSRWIGWGPYLWADGLTPRSDGLTWVCTDFTDDGVHPSIDGTVKVATQLSNFFRADPVARIWFVE